MTVMPSGITIVSKRIRESEASNALNLKRFFMFNYYRLEVMRSNLSYSKLLCFLLPLLPGKVWIRSKMRIESTLKISFIWGLPIILPQKLPSWRPREIYHTDYKLVLLRIFA